MTRHASTIGRLGARDVIDPFVGERRASGPPDAECFSPETRERFDRMPGEQIAGSDAAGWRSLIVERRAMPSEFEYQPSPTPDQTVCVTLRGTYRLERFAAGRWHGKRHAPRSGSMSSPSGASRVRLTCDRPQPVETLHVGIPRRYFEIAHDEYRASGDRSRLEFPETVAIADPVVAEVAIALLDAVTSHEPEMYAQSAAQFLATHLLSYAPSTRYHFEKAVGTCGDRRIANAVALIHERYADPLTLDDLASEANVSRFHFAALFKRVVGRSPCRYLTQTKLAAAARLLTRTDAGIAEIAVMCGYASPAHFATAFRREYDVTPSTFRRRSRVRRP